LLAHRCRRREEPDPDLISGLPVSADDAATIRQSEDFYATEVVVDGGIGIGTGSWAVDSDFGTTRLFSSDEHLVRLIKRTPGKGQFDEVRGVARTISERSCWRVRGGSSRLESHV
jgi:hypothetical protein